MSCLPLLLASTAAFAPHSTAPTEPAATTSYMADGAATIWTFWSQGEADLATKLEHESVADAAENGLFDGVEHKYRFAERCVRAWRLLNPLWRVVLLDEAEAVRLSPAYAALKAAGSGAVQLWSDVLRLDLLSRYGGVWVDVQLCPVHPLDAWLPIATGPTGFFSPW